MVAGGCVGTGYQRSRDGRGDPAPLVGPPHEGHLHDLQRPPTPPGRPGQVVPHLPRLCGTVLAKGKYRTHVCSTKYQAWSSCNSEQLRRSHMLHLVWGVVLSLVIASLAMCSFGCSLAAKTVSPGSCLQLPTLPATTRLHMQCSQASLLVQPCIALITDSPPLQLLHHTAPLFAWHLPLRHHKCLSER